MQGKELQVNSYYMRDDKRISEIQIIEASKNENYFIVQHV